MTKPDIPIDEGIYELQRKIGLPEVFFAKLLDEDDWSFVIKLHALVEAACTHLLSFHFQEPGLQAILSRLELSNTTIGKVAFLKAAELLSKEDRRYIRALSELRNNLVHDVRNCELNLKEMVAGFDQKALKNFAISFSPYESTIRLVESQSPQKESLPSELIEQAKVTNVISNAKENPKFHIWSGAYAVLVEIVNMHHYSDYKQWIKANKIFSESDDSE